MNDEPQIADVLTGLLFVGMAAHLLRQPSIARDIEVAGNAFSSAIRAALGDVNVQHELAPMPASSSAGLMAGVVADWLADEDDLGAADF